MTIGEWFERNAMTGLTPKTLRSHYSLIPMHFGVAVGFVGGVIFGIYTLVLNPDSMFLDAHFYERYRNRTFNFCNMSGVKMPCQAPIYKKEGDPSDESYALPEY